MRSAFWMLLALFACPLPVEAQPAPIPDHLRWTRVEGLLWRIKNDEAPYPLVTTGAFGAPGTGVLFGDQLDYRANAGGKLVLGRWLDPSRTFGIEFSGFCLETHTIHGEFDHGEQAGIPVIARPFFNSLTGQPDTQTITAPQDSRGGRYLGGIDVFGDSRTGGAEVNLLTTVYESCIMHGHALFGIRWLGQKDQLRFSQSSTVLAPGTVGFGGAAAPAPDIVSMKDYFETTNYFYGLQVGLDGRISRGRWFVDLGGKAGAGATDQRQEISGHTLLTDSSGFTQRLPGGLFASPDILGQHERWEFAWVFETSIRIGVAVTPRCELAVGHTFLYWDGVVRPGQQFPAAVDPRQTPSNLAYVGPNPSRVPEFNSTSFWAHGLTASFTFRY